MDEAKLAQFSIADAERLEEELSEAQHRWLLETGQAVLGKEGANAQATQSGVPAANRK